MKLWCLLFSLLLLAIGCATSQPASTSQPTGLRRADAAFQRGEYPESILLYKSFLGTDPDDEDYVRASYRMATAYHRLGRDEEAAKVIENLRDRYPEGDWPAVWAVYGDIEVARGHNVSAVLWWERAYVVAPENDRGQLSSRIANLVMEMSPEERNQVRTLATTELLRQAMDRAKNFTPRATATPTAMQTEAATATETPGPGSARIALLLPLSGKYRAIGEASLTGAKVAVSRDENLHPVDTHGNAGGALAEFQAVQADVSVAAIVGPLRGDEADAVAPRASAASIPLLPLSQNELSQQPFVFQTAMTRTLQAQTLAAYAARRLGVKRFAVVHPGDAYGARFADLFRTAVQSEGGRVVGNVIYSPGATDFTRTVDDLQALVVNGGVTAAFLPDSAETVALLAPEIRRTMPTLQLLGSSEWNEGSILAGVANSIDGAIFVDGFYANSTRPATQQFVEKFRKRYGRRPGILEAQAHDAVALIETAIGRAAFSRQEIQLVLENLGLFEGAGGTIDISGGVVRRQLFLLRFRNGSLEELSW